MSGQVPGFFCIMRFPAHRETALDMFRVRIALTCALVACVVATAATADENATHTAPTSIAPLPYYRANPVEVNALNIKTLPALSYHAFLFFHEPWLNASTERLAWITEANRAHADVNLKSMFVGFMTVEPTTEVVPEELNQSLLLLYKQHDAAEWVRIAIESIDDVTANLRAAVNATAAARASLDASLQTAFADAIAPPLVLHVEAADKYFLIGEFAEAAEHAVHAHVLLASTHNSTHEAVPTSPLLADLVSAISSFEAGAAPDFSHAEYAALLVEAYCARAAAEPSDMQHHFATLRALVRPTDVVLELGCVLGIWVFPVIAVSVPHTQRSHDFAYQLNRHR